MPIGTLSMAQMAEPSPADPQLLLRRLVDAGASIQRFELVRPSLHQFFLQKVGARAVEAGMTE